MFFFAVPVPAFTLAQSVPVSGVVKDKEGALINMISCWMTNERK
jgi:hypothetical protein